MGFNEAHTRQKSRNHCIMAMVNGYIYIFCVVVGKVRAGEDVISFDKHLYYIYICIAICVDTCKLLVTRK